MDKLDFEILEDIENELGVKLGELETMKNNLEGIYADLEVLQLRLGKILDDVNEFKE